VTDSRSVRRNLRIVVAQMLNLDLIGGISFSKGCYTGQEIIARTQHLGRIKRRMSRLRLPSASWAIASPSNSRRSDGAADRARPGGRGFRSARGAQSGRRSGRGAERFHRCNGGRRAAAALQPRLSDPRNRIAVVCPAWPVPVFAAGASFHRFRSGRHPARGGRGHLDRPPRPRVTREFQGRLWSVPARVFAAPLELYAGAPISANDLEQELHRLHYRRGDRHRGPASIGRTGNAFDLEARRVRFIDEQRDAQRVSIHADNASITSMRAADAPICPCFVSIPGDRQLVPIHGEDRLIVAPADVPPLLRTGSS